MVLLYLAHSVNMAPVCDHRVERGRVASRVQEILDPTCTEKAWSSRDDALNIIITPCVRTCASTDDINAMTHRAPPPKQDVHVPAGRVPTPMDDNRRRLAAAISKVLRFKLHANSVRIPYLKNTFEPLASRRLKQSSQTDPQVEVNFLSGRSDRLHYELTDLLMQRPTSL